MICILYNEVIASTLNVLLKEIKESFTITFSSIFFHQPNFMKLNKILLTTKKLLQRLSVLFVSRIPLSMFLSAGFIPNRAREPESPF